MNLSPRKKLFVDTFIFLQYLSLLFTLVSSFYKYDGNGFFEMGFWIVIYYLIFNIVLFVLCLPQLIAKILWGDETGRHALLSRGWRFWNKSLD